MNSDLIFQLALCQVPYVGAVNAKKLVDHFGSAENIFSAHVRDIEAIEDIGPVKANKIKHFRDFRSAENEIRFIEKYRIEPLFLTDPGYPRRLLNCYDPPTLLFYRGNVNLNSSRIISIIGTRSSTEYGKSITEKLVQALQSYEVIIVSGLAFGIDSFAHRSAIKNNIPTIGVLAHGLDTIYPPEHSALAKNMIKHGGLLSEFKSNTQPDKHNFPSRNRVVAGISDATIVVETGLKGGSLITANLANSYHRDVFACPGRITDPKSLGCNLLIKSHKASLLTSPEEFIETMGWNDDKHAKQKKARQLFDDLNEHEQKIIDLLNDNAPMHIDELMFKSGMSNSLTASVILGLELKSIIATLPGKRFNLI
jgi:DNA processing protein